MHPIAGIFCILGLLGLMLGLVRCFKLPPELSRKSIHVSLGLACLSFPWLFDRFWPVGLLCAASIGGLLWLRGQKGDLNAVLHGVLRDSWGELCFPIAVAVLFLLKHDPIPDYLIPLLLLTLADAVGALIGVRYGQSKYSTDEGFKSLEGSLAFFLTAFICTHICLLLSTATGRTESLLIAAIIGLLVMLIEGISRRGMDNLWIPLVSYLLINSYLDMGWQVLVGRLLMLMGILVFFLLLRRRSYANDSVLLASALVLYLIFAVASWIWAITPIALALFYGLTCPSCDKDRQTRHGQDDLLAICGGGLLWLLLSINGTDLDLALPFIATWAAQIAILFAAHMTRKRPRSSTAYIFSLGAALGGSLSLPSLLLIYQGTNLMIALSLILAGCALAATCLWKLEWQRTGSTLSPGRPIRQFAYGLAASAPALTINLFLP
ncbi:MAG: diacylglycerol/polyprenol kinase family protein [Opitutales bacterium]